MRVEANDYGKAPLRALDERCRAVLASPGRPLSGLAVVLIADGEIAWEGYFGARRFAAGAQAACTPAEAPADGRGADLPVDRNTRWRAASISKPAAALGAMRLVEAGLLDLDRDVSDYLGYSLRNPAFPDAPITLRTVLGHTSSLRDADFYYPPLGTALSELLLPGGRLYENGAHFAAPGKGPGDGGGGAAAAGPDLRPGAFYEYCNLGYGVLGSVVERVTGERFDLYMKRALFDPVGIDAAYNPCLLSDEAFGNLSPIYRKAPSDSEAWDTEGPWHPQIDDYRKGKPALPVRLPAGAPPGLSLGSYVPGENGSLFSPQGGMRISALDLAAIARLFIDGGVARAGRGDVRLLSERSIEAMATPGWTFAGAGETAACSGGGGNACFEHSPVYATGIGLMRPTGPGGGPAMWGHRGNAYGFLGGMFFDRESRRGYVYMIGGVGADPDLTRAPSGLSVWEDELGTAIEAALRSI
ncbi:beta-lactamase family protein [bacterium]|nr:beta-lactamase family protein [bacterium]